MIFGHGFWILELALWDHFHALRKDKFHRIFLLLGGNQGDRNAYLTEARKLISKRIGLIINFSAIYETEPWGFVDEMNFLNQVIEIQSVLLPDVLMEEISEIEKLLGRRRVELGYHSRTIDVDILFYGDLILDTERLVIPHPRIRERRFVLVPMSEIAMDFIHPVYKTTMAELLQNCKDDSLVRKYFEDGENG